MDSECENILQIVQVTDFFLVTLLLCCSWIHLSYRKIDIDMLTGYSIECSSTSIVVKLDGNYSFFNDSHLEVALDYTWEKTSFFKKTGVAPAPWRLSL